jgi:hypothetical protein
MKIRQVAQTLWGGGDRHTHDRHSISIYNWFRGINVTNFDVNLVFGCLHLVGVGSVAEISEVHAASVFRIEVCRVSEFVYV